jgi:hypothetical protein
MSTVLSTKQAQNFDCKCLGKTININFLGNLQELTDRFSLRDEVTAYGLMRFV